MMLSNHYPVTFANRAAIPAIVTCVVVAGALVRYFYNRWHAEEDAAKAPWWAWLAAAVAIWAAFWVAMASSPGMRPELGLAPAPEPTLAAGLDLPRAPQAVVDVVRDALRHVPRAGAGLGRDRHSAQRRHARHARAHRRAGAGDPHAGGADPRHAAQQPDRDDRRRAPRARRIGSPALRSPAIEGSARDGDDDGKPGAAADGAARRARRLHRRSAQTDPALPVAVAPARRRAVHRVGQGERLVGAHRSGRQRARALRGRAAGRAGADDRLAYRHRARRRPLRRRARRARRARASSRASRRKGDGSTSRSRSSPSATRKACASLTP